MRAADSRAWTPLADAVAAYEGGRHLSVIEVRAGGGTVRELPVREIYAFPGADGDIVSYALALSRGHVLDVGAGTGRLALELQSRSIRVTAIDASQDAVATMRRRGVGDARVSDLATFEDARYDTVLLVSNGAGLAGTVVGLQALFARAKDLLAPGGQLLIDSEDLLLHPDSDVRAAARERAARGIHPGEETIVLAFDGAEGAPFPWLFVDAETLAESARVAGWHAHIVYADGGRFLARLVPL